MSFYKSHVFICTNKKENKTCCGNNNLSEIIEYAKQKIAALGITKDSRFRISSSGCMGRCSLGPVIAVYPQGIWYSYSCKEDIDKILSATLAGQLCEELLIHN